jgi:hypothetical protein
MKKLLQKLFGSGGPKAPKRGEGTAYKDLTIYPQVQSEGGQWRVAGIIAKGDGDAAVEHHFIRADLLSSHDEAEAFAVRKGRQIIDERGDRLFVERKVAEPD